MAQPYDIAVRSPQTALGPKAPSLRGALPSESPEPSMLKPILRQWWIVLLCALIAVGAAWVYVSHVQPLYTSYEKLYIEPPASAVVEALGTGQRDTFLATQVDKITSTPILQHFADDPDFLRMKTFAGMKGRIVDYLQYQLEVTLEHRTDLINVSFTSAWPDEACQVVKRICDVYIKDATEVRDVKSRDVLNTLNATRDDQDKAVALLLEQKKEFISTHPLANGQKDFGGLVAENLKQVQDAMTTAELSLVELQAASGPNHPAVKRLKETIDNLRLLYNDKLEELRKNGSDNFDVDVLDTKIQAHQDMSKRCQDRINQIEMAIAGQPSVQIDIHEPALVPEMPSFPHKKRMMAVAVVAGMLLGAGLALLRDRLDGRLRSVEEIQLIIGLPIFGVVPAMTGRHTAVARAMKVHLDPRSPVAEAYRTIRTAVYFGIDGSHCKTLLITSPESSDGKTTSASNLAIAIAQTGRSVLLLDADFRKPSQHKNLELDSAVGLSSVLAGQETIDKAIQHTGVEGLDILPCGPIPANPSEILNSREFGELVDSLAQRYDHIVFDSPPVNLVTDARILGAVCDATILVLRADKSTRKAGEHARNALLSVGARVVGAIVNDAPRGRGYEVYGGSYYGRGSSPGGALPAA